MTRLIDFAVFPLFMLGAFLEASLLLRRSLPSTAVIIVVTSTAALAAAILERGRPERLDYVRLDQPLRTEIAHYFFNLNLGYVLGLLPLAVLGAAIKSWPARWPSHWPGVLQVAFAVSVGEAFSYWQHRFIHRSRRYWPFHALHHSGGRLNLMRSVRFHFMDFGPAIFLAVLPLTLLRAPDSIVTWIAVFSGAIGIIQHSNVRMRTPRLLDLIVCTPAVHRRHHSLEASESDSNFGTTIMLWDLLFGSYSRPDAAGPAAVGVRNDGRRPGFVAQMFDPFRRPRAAALLAAALLAAAAPRVSAAEKLELPGLPNLARVEKGVYRGGRPRLDREGVQSLVKLGIKTVVNLEGGDLLSSRGAHLHLRTKLVLKLEPGEKPSAIEAESRALMDAGIESVNIPLDSLDPVTSTEAARIDRAVGLLAAADPAHPVYVHCEHGVDRTGLAIALYRMRADGWSLKRASAEMAAMGHTGRLRGLFTKNLDLERVLALFPGLAAALTPAAASPPGAAAR